jgi:hypothetical protein
MTTKDNTDNNDIIENIKNISLGKYPLPENSKIDTETIYTQLHFYEMGRRNEIPLSWISLNDQLDPEFSEYLRLKEKFRGRNEKFL